MCTKVCQWLAGKRRRKTVNRLHTSYGYKHMAEKDIGEYVTNGCFIAAAVHCGFDYSPCADNSPNVWFNISEKSLGIKRERLNDED